MLEFISALSSTSLIPFLLLQLLDCKTEKDIYSIQFMVREVLEMTGYAGNGKSVVREDWEETFPASTWKGRPGTVWIWNKIRSPKTAWKTASLEGETNQPFCLLQEARLSKILRAGLSHLPFWVMQIEAVTGDSTSWGQSSHCRRLTRSFNLVFCKQLLSCLAGSH